MHHNSDFTNKQNILQLDQYHRIYFLLLLMLTLVSCSTEKQFVTEPPLPLRLDSLELFKQTFKSPEDCKSCHPKHFEEWEMSMHAYAVIDPIFIAVNNRAQSMTKGDVGEFCIACHAPTVPLLNEAPNNLISSPQTTLSRVSRGGVTCDGCHKIQASSPGHGISKFYTDGIYRSSVRNPVANNYHTSLYDSTFERGEICQGCHDVVNVRGVRMEHTFTEWRGSSYPGRSITCQACHMKPTREAVAVGGPTTGRLRHDHVMEGVDIALVDFPGRDKMIERVAFQLDFSVVTAIEQKERTTANTSLAIDYSIYNQITGHNVPSGSVFERQMWVEAVFTDAQTGDTILTSGLLDPNGDLRNDKSEYVVSGKIPADTLLTLFHGKAYKQGQQTPFFFEGDRVWRNTIPPLQTRYARYVIPASEMRRGRQIHLDFRLRFRAMAPYFMRLVGHADLIDKVPIFTMEHDEKTITVE